MLVNLIELCCYAQQSKSLGRLEETGTGGGLVNGRPNGEEILGVSVIALVAKLTVGCCKEQGSVTSLDAVSFLGVHYCRPRSILLVFLNQSNKSECLKKLMTCSYIVFACVFS